MASNQNLYFKITVLTPTHVGMEKEKEWINGIDFVVEGNEVLVLNRDALFRKLKKTSMLENYTRTLLDGGRPQDMLKFLKSKQLISPDIILKRYKSYTSSIDTIKPQLHDGLGQHYIPGSSIKGAIRSILGNKINPNKLSNPKDFDNLFGNINNNLMRMVQVADVQMGNTCLVNTKIYSADGRPENGEGTWKDRNQGGHNARFNPDQFNPSFEALAAGAAGKLKIKLTCIQDFHEKYQAGMNIPNHNHIARFRQEFVDIVNQHNKNYIEKELAYYKEYVNDTLGEQAINFYNKLKEETAHNTCILRLGGNVGYHAITGDMVYPNHLIWIDQTNNRERHKNQIKAKTRKFAFSKNKEGWQFLPMGWVKLEMIDETTYHNLKFEVATQSNATESVSEIVEPPKPAEPKFFDGKIKEGAKIDAKVISCINGKIKAELFIKDAQLTMVEFNYRAGLEVGRLIKVNVTSVNKKTNRIENVGFEKYL